MNNFSLTSIPPIVRLSGTGRAAVRVRAQTSAKLPPTELVFPAVSQMLPSVTIGTAEKKVSAHRAKRVPRYKRSSRRR